MGRENSKYFSRFYLFYHLLLAVLGLCCSAGFSLVVGSKSYSLVKALGLLIAVASLIAEHGLWGAQASVVQASGLSSCGSRALEHRLSGCGPRA